MTPDRIAAAFADHGKHMSEMPACQRPTALRPRFAIDFAKRIIRAMLSEEDRPELRSEAFRIKHL